MARRKVGRYNEVKVDLASYDYYLRGEGGIGKTTLAYEIGRKYGRNAMLILEVGQENGVEHLYDAYVDEVKTWQDLTDVIDDIVEYRDTDYSHLKFICIDSTDELFRLAEQEVVRLHNKECQPDKRTKSINGCFGGFPVEAPYVSDNVL